MRQAELTVTAIRLVPGRRDRSPGIGTWLWDVGPWLDRPEQLVAAAKRQGVADIFLQVPIKDGGVTDVARLHQLIDALSGAEIAVHAVEGDPDMASVAGRVHAVERARVLARFRQDGAGLRSFQYDIEPYLRPAFRADPDAAWRDWALSVKALADTLGDKISVVVPFWMLGDGNGERALRMASGSIDAITVMAYRTDVAEVERIAQDWLEWGAARDLPVSIALENGLLPAEVHRTYVRAPRGDLLLDTSAPLAIARLLPNEVAGTYTQLTYSFTYEVRVEPSRISFLGDGKAVDLARARLERNLGAWTSFGGLLVHELITPGG